MGERKRLYLLILIMTTVSMIVAGITIYGLYGAAFEEEKARLTEIAQSNAGLIEAVARFDAIHSKKDHPEGAQGATISQVIDAHKRYKGFGETGEFTLARREGDSIVFLISHRHYDLDKPKPVPWNSKLAEPTRLALSGKSGTVIGLDYRNMMVLAAYEPVAILNLGIVAKIDLAEIRAPFIRAGLIAIGLGFLVVIGGAVLFLRVSNPMIRRIEESEERYRAIVEDQTELIYRFLPGGILSFVNEAYCSYFGKSSDELIGESFLKFIPEDDQQSVQKRLDFLSPENPVVTYEHRVIMQGGEVRLQQWSYRAIFSAGDRLIEYQSVGRDVTERKRAEARLSLQGTALESAANAIVITDCQGRITWVNPAFTHLTGYTSEEVVGQNPRILQSGKHGPDFYQSLWGTILGGRVWRGETINKRKDGSLYSEEMTVTPVRDMDGEITHFIAVKEDITERKKAEEELCKAKEAAEAANRAKSDFLASMSHELRTPLNSIIGFSEVLSDQYFGELNEKQSDYVNDILESGRHLLSLINDILDLSKIEAGKMELELSGVKIRDLLENSLVMIKEKSYKHGISLDLQIPGELSDLEITADERKLKQIMFNLLSNAAKFTPDHGSITVAAQLRSKDEGGKTRDDASVVSGNEATGRPSSIVISVADTGIGITPEDQERIFGEFFQSRGGIVDKTPGTGLGLPISKSMVEMHGGRMWVESDGEGKGSRFSFVLPLKTGFIDTGEPKAQIDESNDRVSNDENLLKHLETMISLSKRHNKNLSICRLYTDFKVLQANLPDVKNALENEKRDHDFLVIGENGCIYLILQETNRQAAKKACARIAEKLESILDGQGIDFSTATFPQDGETSDILIKRIRLNDT